MSIQDLQAIMWSDDDALCEECGEILHSDNVSLEAFEMLDRMMCIDCYASACEVDDDEDEPAHDL